MRLEPVSYCLCDLDTEPHMQFNMYVYGYVYGYIPYKVLLHGIHMTL